MKRLLKWAFWLFCFALACLLLTAGPITQGMAVGLATIPVTEGVDDAHARIILSVLSFVALSWLALWVAEAVALLVTIEIARAFTKWYYQIRWANDEYTVGEPLHAHVQGGV